MSTRGRLHGGPGDGELVVVRKRPNGEPPWTHVHQQTVYYLTRSRLDDKWGPVYHYEAEEP